mmetsp:Transcript_10188/g.15923  ORF Transcript_10188/g.15923 Transcript_10188/m.15923 type:complete len:183 (-) Transcript_10188:114-662(-)|eukprot:CAMPEP_0184322082 /NCGR_PEP_ID=MMETSP1049-20130417/122753_1 /TAXON_ID=77928 /ORGANISM="Proteomonas sulcata, Strain CCMP704" /LENGTH=182 /DNA_ID=CAMNT_0026643105 /DNA_START=214 /DNA_END=762 /DNA_ORIENTATION=+
MPVTLWSPKEAGGSNRQSLRDWVKQQTASGRRVGGVLAAQHDGKQSIESLVSKEVRIVQLNEITAEIQEKMKKFKESMSKESEFHNSFASDLAANYSHPVVTVGPFVFDEEVLEWARQLVLTAITDKVDVVVVDEIGPLEVKRGLGLDSAFRKCLEVRDQIEIVIVVRDNLREKLVDQYGLD